MALNLAVQRKRRRARLDRLQTVARREASCVLRWAGKHRHVVFRRAGRQHGSTSLVLCGAAAENAHHRPCRS
jgi:hypothetical protein